MTVIFTGKGKVARIINMDNVLQIVRREGCPRALRFIYGVDECGNPRGLDIDIGSEFGADHVLDAILVAKESGQECVIIDEAELH